MKRPSPPRGIGQTLARVQGNAITWLAVLLPLSLASIFGILYFVREIRGASRLLGLPQSSAEAVLVDLCVASLPVIVVIAVYLRQIKQARTRLRTVFLAAHEGQLLVQLPAFPSLVYQQSADRLVLVWNADGPVSGGPAYPLPETPLRPLDRDRFAATGTP